MHHKLINIENIKVMKDIRIVDKFLLLGLTINRGLPLDKVSVFVYVIYFLLKKEVKLTYYNRWIIAALSCVVLLSFCVNFLANVSFQILYPLVFVITGCMIAASDMNLLTIRKILLVNVIFGIIASLLAINGYSNDFSLSLWEKNLPWLYAPFGFSPAIQVFGTFCILVLIISFEYKKFDLFFFITLIAIALTMNRATFVFLAILIFVYKPKVFFMMAILGCFFIIKNWEELELVLFSTTNLNSRVALRQGAELSFWQSNDLIVYLFGRGTPRVSESFAAQTQWERTYIEHGLDFLLHSYGFLGVLVISIIIMSFLFYLFWIKKEKGLFLITFYYFVIEQLLTHEFLASSLCFVVACILLIIKKHDLERLEIAKQTVNLKNIHIFNKKL